MERNKSLVLSQDNVSISKIEDFLFEVDKGLEDILINDKLYEIAYILQHNSLYNWDNNKYLDKIENKNYPKEFLERVVVFMILRWITEVVLLQNKFNISTKNIPVDVFVNWIKEQWKNIFASDYFDEFVFLCNDIEKLVFEIWKLWYINIAYEFIIKYDVKISKYSRKNIITIIENLERYINSFSLMQKMSLWWYYDWYDIVDNLFEDSDKILNYVLNLFKINDKQKDEFNNLKDKHFNILYKENLKDIEKEIIDKDFTISLELEHNLLTKDRFKDNFLKWIQEWLIKLNYANWFVVHFLDITWNSVTFSISNNNYKFWYNYWLLQKEQFYKDVVDYYEYFQENLWKNDVDFVVILAESNGSKYSDDNYNDSFYKKAA